jgi:hypothetical protein
MPIRRNSSALRNQRRRVGVLQAEQEALPAGLLVEMQDVGIAHDVVGAGGADQDQIDVLGNQRLQECLPRLLGGGRVLVGEVYDLDAVLAMEPRQLLGKAHGVAVAPSGPEPALAAVGAQMRAAARELHDRRAQAAPVAVAGVVDQLPADSAGVEIADDGRRPRRVHARRIAPGDAGHILEVLAVLDRRHQAPRRLLAFAPDDRRHVGLLRQDLAPVIGRKDAAIDDAYAGQDRGDAARDLGDHRMAGGRAGMAEQDGVRRPRRRLRHQVGDRHGTELGVDQAHFVAVVDQRPADGKEAQRRQMIVRDAAADRRVRDIDQENAHGIASHRLDVAGFMDSGIGNGDQAAATGGLPSPPKRRSRTRNQVSASARSPAPKSGQNRSVK